MHARTHAGAGWIDTRTEGASFNSIQLVPLGSIHACLHIVQLASWRRLHGWHMARSLLALNVPRYLAWQEKEASAAAAAAAWLAGWLAGVRTYTSTWKID